MSLKDVINCPTRICGHAFVLATMLIHGSDFSIDDLPTVDPANEASGYTSHQPVCYPVKIVNRKTYKGRSEYIGRTMPGLAGSPLRTNTKYDLTAATRGKNRYSIFTGNGFGKRYKKGRVPLTSNYFAWPHSPSNEN